LVNENVLATASKPSVPEKDAAILSASASMNSTSCPSVVATSIAAEHVAREYPCR